MADDRELASTYGTGGDGLTVVMAHSPPGFILICLLVFLDVLASTSWYSRKAHEYLLVLMALVVMA